MAKVRLKFDIFKPDGTYINPASLMNNITWSGDIDSPSRELSFNIAWPTFEKEIISKLNIEMGDVIKMFISYNDSEFKEQYRGKILSINKSSSSQTMSLRTKDFGMFLNNKLAMLSENFTPDKVAKEAIKKVSDSKYAPIIAGKFPSANIKYNKIVTGSSAYDVIQAAYTEASKKTKKKYMTYAYLDKINVAEIGENVLSLNFNVGENVISTRYNTDISKMVNQIIVTDDKGNTVNVKKDTELLKLYNTLMNEIETQEQNGNTKGFVKPDKKLSMRCSGNIKLMTGSAIRVKDDVTGLVGIFYVIKDKHTFNPYLTEVDLSFEKVMHETEISDSKSSSDSAFGTNGVVNASGKAGAVIKEVKSHLGKPYSWGATGPSRFDCSGLMQYCYRRVGVNLPRTSKEQAKVGTKVIGPYQPGDLLFFGNPIRHVGMYIGNNEYIHAPQTGDVVKITKCGRKVTVARRVL